MGGRSSSEAADIAQLLQQLEESGTLEDLDLAGTEWRLLYTESKGSSSGKIAIGPFKFVGRVAQVGDALMQHTPRMHYMLLLLMPSLIEQVFPKEQPGQYINKVDFGLLQADLLANYKQTAKDRILVSFEYIEFKLGPLRFKQVIILCHSAPLTDPYNLPLQHSRRFVLCTQDISNGRPDTSGGYWRLAYTDERFRVLYTNLGNVFILVR